MRRRFIQATALLVVGLLVGGTLFAQDCASYVEQPSVNHFVLVVDRSGSMGADRIRNAQIAVRDFASAMRPGDYVSLITFAGDIRRDVDFTDDPSRIVSAISRLSAGGNTRLYDAIYMAAHQLTQRSGVRAIIFFTDGDDTGSDLTMRELSQMNIAESALVYGVGLGTGLDHTPFRSLARATGGDYSVAQEAVDVPGIYATIQEQHYRFADDQVNDRGGYTITSFPSGRPAYLDGQGVGRTPVRLDGIAPGDHLVQVEFDLGVWECNAPVRSGYRNVVRAREQDLPLSLVIETAPTRSAVFVDGTYVGLSSIAPTFLNRGSRDVSMQLTLEDIPRGTHTIKVVAAPDAAEFLSGGSSGGLGTSSIGGGATSAGRSSLGGSSLGGSSLGGSSLGGSSLGGSSLGGGSLQSAFEQARVMEFEVTITDRPLFVKALVFLQQIEYYDGTTERIGGPAVPSFGGSSPFGGGSPFGGN